MANPSNDVYVFGAGATKALGGPLSGEFLSLGFYALCAQDLVKVPADSFYKVARLIDTLYGSNVESEVREAASKRIGIRPDLPDGITIEELLTFVELGIENHDSWMDFDVYKLALQDFIFETLEWSIFPGRYGHNGIVTVTTSGPCKENPNVYDLFITSRIDRCARNCFISFNYEDFLDRALWFPQPPVCADYSMPFMHVEWPQYDRMLREGFSPERADLLKLHGSLNWAKCKKCGFQLFPYTTYRRIFSLPCVQCSASLSPVLVPPTLRKKLKEYGIGHLWDKADQAISAADNITIIGYSFPDADIEAKWLFKRAVAKGGKKPSLTIVDPCERVRKKILEFFGKTVGHTVLVENFETYVENS